MLSPHSHMRQQQAARAAAEFMALCASDYAHTHAHTYTSAHISASVIACAVEIVPSRTLAGFVNWQFLCRTKSLCDAISLSLSVFYIRFYSDSGCICWAESWGSKEQRHLSRTRSRMAGTFILSYYNTHCALSFSLSRAHTRPYKCMHNAALLFAF